MPGRVPGVMKRGLKLTAVAAMVVLALTGFSTSRGHGHSRGHSSGGGGGCSSSSQNHGGSSNSSTSGGSSSGYDDDDDDTYGSSGSTDSSTGGYTRRPRYRSTPTSSATGSGQQMSSGKARLITCATPARPYATVEVTNPNRKKATFDVLVDFLDKDGVRVTDGYQEVKVPANGRATAKIKVGGSGLVDEVATCDVDPVALLSD